MDINYSDDVVLLERCGDGVAKIILNDPPLNLMTVHMNRCLGRVLDEVAADESIRVVVLMAAGERAFSAGAHVKEFAEFVRRGSMVEDKLTLECEVNEKLTHLPQPTIAALHALTLGGGIEVALCCDYRVVGESVSIGYPEIRLGLFPGGGGLSRVSELLGAARTKALFLFGETLSAREALALGAVNEVLADNQVVARAMERAVQLAKMPGDALRAIKKGIDDVSEMSAAQGIEYSLGLMNRVLATPDVREGVAAFVEKREARFNQKTGKEIP